MLQPECDPEKSQVCQWVMEILRNPALENQIKYTPPSEDYEGKSGIFNYMCTEAVNGEWGNLV